MFTGVELANYQRGGWALARGLVSPEEVTALRDHYMDLRARGSYPGDTAGVETTSTDPLKRFPRMIHMHRWDEISLSWMLDPRLGECMTRLLGVEPVAVQTMLYFKPAGARGQALHQDQFYLRAKPGDCMAAWMALDDCDEENGCLQVVPESGDLPVLCTRKADTTQSFTDVTVELPEGVEAIPVRMKAGDVFFFNGSVIHGSYPNRTTDRFRRALIGHYVTAITEEVSQFYMPALRMDGTEVPIRNAQGGGACGVWTEVDGRRVVEMAAT